MCSRAFAVTLAVLLGIMARPPETTAAERILIPVFLGERNPGGFGFPPHVYGWITSAFVANESTEPVEGHGVRFSLHCDIPEGCAYSSIPPGMIGEIFAPVSEAGLVLEIPDPERVSVAAWASRWPSGLPATGAQLPIAREGDFISRPLHFLAVPIGFGVRDRIVRIHLRVYSLGEQPARVRVEMRNFFTLAEPIHEAHEFDLLDMQSPAPSQYAFIDLVAHFPGAGAHSTWENVSVIPLAAADGSVPAIWAFVSITSSTNEVRIMPPA